MPKVTAAVLTVLVVVTLAGCAGTSDSAGNERTAPAVTESAAPDSSGTPLVAETAAPETDADRVFLAYVHDALQPDTQIGNASDASLVQAGHAACDQIRSGVAIEDVRVIDGETPNASGYYADSSSVRNAAQVAYCPETL